MTLPRKDIRLVVKYAALHGKDPGPALFKFASLPPARQDAVRMNMRRELKDPAKAAQEREEREAEARVRRAEAAQEQLRAQVEAKGDARVAALRATVEAD